MVSNEKPISGIILYKLFFYYPIVLKFGENLREIYTIFRTVYKI